MQQSNYFQTINALLQQFQHPQPLQNSPILPPVNPLQQQLLHAVQAADQSTLHQGGFNALFQSLQQQTPQPSNTATLPTQLLSDALKLIAPVGQSPNDEQLLVMALHSGLSQGFDHKRAIETLHGVNNHAANLWKDYYLEHKTRIDEMVSQLQPAKTTKKPVRFDLETSSASSEIKGKQPQKERLSHAGDPSASAPSGIGPSRTHPIPLGSESPLPPRVRRHHSSSWDPDLSNPSPPEDEPLPPTKVVKVVRGNLYTAEDKKYFAKYISWAIQNDPSLTKGEIIARLAERVPHHTANSWSSYWARDHLADKILARVKGKMAEKYTRDGEEDGQDSEKDYSSYDEEDDEATMGESGGAFGATDIRAMAKHIAKYSSTQWAEMSNKQRWFPFHEEYPQRSDKCYMEKYRTMEPEFLRLAEKYRRRTRKQLEMQRGTPSWANAVGRKRRSSVHGSPNKRTREVE
ncbi:hypothetical protein EDB84DRAFT_1477015 [Lactarius hengduanensis]|nr:hypothetical protein EDB85DRAFT_2111624 [Lactarius pseudohatsudake]KAH9039930.1 hypothetical protein EDB84DRAFT_1477015 [Lactarius hengduanensis]